MRKKKNEREEQKELERRQKVCEEQEVFLQEETTRQPQRSQELAELRGRLGHLESENAHVSTFNEASLDMVAENDLKKSSRHTAPQCQGQTQQKP